MKNGDVIEQRWKGGAILDNERYPYVLIDNWYTEEEEKRVWGELNFIGQIPLDKTERAETTIVAKKDDRPLSQAYRYYIEDYYKDRRISQILNCGYKARSKEFHDLIKTCLPYYRSFASTNNDSTLISYYEENDNYEPHYDSFAWTMLIWMVREPRHFDGGNFILNEVGHEIKLKNNRMVMFPSCYLHSVTPIKFHTQPTKNGMGRYCITHFYFSTPQGNPEPTKFNNDGTKKNA